MLGANKARGRRVREFRRFREARRSRACRRRGRELRAPLRGADVGFGAAKRRTPVSRPPSPVPAPAPSRSRRSHDNSRYHPPRTPRHADSHPPVPRPGPRHLRTAQEGLGIPAAALPRELRPVDVRCRPTPQGGDAGARRGRPLLQPRGDPDGHPDGGGQRDRAHHRRARRAPLHAGRVASHPAAQGRRRDHPLRQPQSRRPRRRFRDQVQHRQRRAGAGEGHRGDRGAHARDHRVSHRRLDRRRARCPR